MKHADTQQRSMQFVDKTPQCACHTMRVDNDIKSASAQSSSGCRQDTIKDDAITLARVMPPPLPVCNDHTGKVDDSILTSGEVNAIEIFTTRPDTIFGATFMVIAPESKYAEMLTAPQCRAAVEEYCMQSRRRSERERIADRSVSGVFTGRYVKNPVTQQPLPVWISDYVLASYGTGAIMAVPAHDSRDYAFAMKFNLPITPVIEGCDVSQQSYDVKDGIMCNSGFLNGMQVKDAIAKMKDYIAQHGIGSVKVNYRLRDAVFSRQRYWGEPFPIYYKDGIPCPLPEHALPLRLPQVDKYMPTDSGEPPLARAAKWAWDEAQEKVVDNCLIDNVRVFPLEKNTMPGFAGSSAYFLRYMDNANAACLVSREKNEYWRRVDLYLGGIEHATGHLIHSRFWNKFLCDIGVVCEDEPFKKLINQGMIQGRSSFVHRITGSNTFVSAGLKDRYDTQKLHVDISLVDKDILDIEKFKQWRSEYASAEFILEDGRYVCEWAIEKMSKSMHNVVNPSDVADAYGADTLRMYVMFLGPLELSKPWDTAGIEGVHRFLRKLWRLYFDGEGRVSISEEPLTAAELKTLHKTIKKVGGDIEAFSFNTAVSALMICVNELFDLRCNKRGALQPLALLLAPFAPHAGEELWRLLGNKDSVCYAPFPDYDQKYLAETEFEYPVSFNGRVRFKKRLPLGITAQEAQQQTLADPAAVKFMDGKKAKKVIFVEGRIVNIVL
jgi:leucyl-tRNA synthetase